MITRIRPPIEIEGLPVNWPDLVLSASELVLDAFGVRRLELMVTDGEMLLQLWSAPARRFKWTAMDLFGVHPIAPAARYDAMGLVPLLHGSVVRQLTADEALIASPTGGRLTYRRSLHSGGSLIWDVGKSPEATDAIRIAS